MTCETSNGHALTVTETAKLENLETVIDGGLKSFVEVGRALVEVREGRLYRGNHVTFEKYCQERWGMSADYARKHIAAAETVNLIERDSTNTIVLPSNESQVRPLTKLPSEDRASAWMEAIEASPEGRPTAAIVEEVVASRLPEPSEQAKQKSVTPAKERADGEAEKFIREFQETAARICDGSVYTTEALIEVTRICKTNIQWFVRLCEVSPWIKVHRNCGHKNSIQYTFEKTQVATSHGRIRQLAEQIVNDPNTGAKSSAAAKKILSLLGG